MPSTIRRTLVSEILTICRIRQTVPTSYRSSSSGSAVPISRWVTRNTLRSLCMALSSAKIEISRSASRLSVRSGKAVNPRSARTGMFIVVVSMGFLLLLEKRRDGRLPSFSRLLVYDAGAVGAPVPSVCVPFTRARCTARSGLRRMTGSAPFFTQSAVIVTCSIV